MMNSLDKQSDFESLHALWQSARTIKGIGNGLETVAQYGARSSWMLAKWGDMEKAVNLMPPENKGITKDFYNCIVMIKRSQFDAFSSLADKCRKQLDCEITVLLGESYERAYPYLVAVQQLSELDEIVLQRTRSLTHIHALHRDRLKVLWNKRLRQMKSDRVLKCG